jgi:hypothetical protein
MPGGLKASRIGTNGFAQTQAFWLDSFPALMTISCFRVEMIILNCKAILIQT